MRRTVVHIHDARRTHRTACSFAYVRCTVLRERNDRHTHTSMFCASAQVWWTQVWWTRACVRACVHAKHTVSGPESSALVVDNLRSEVNSGALGNCERVSTKGPAHKVRKAVDTQRVVFAKTAAPKLLVDSCAGNAITL